MRHRLLTYLLLLPLLCLAQAKTKENCIRVSTFLNAAGTDSITDITYYDKLGRESTSFTQIELGDVYITSISSSSPVYYYKLKDHLFAKIGFRVGKSVAKQGISALTKTATYAEAVSDITDDIKTVGNGKAWTTDMLIAGG